MSVGFAFPGGEAQHLAHKSRSSLMDADVIVFEPESHFYEPPSYQGPNTYQGKPALHERRAFELRERTSHWKRELLTALESGKTVFAFLVEPADCFVDTGQRTY